MYDYHVHTRLCNHADGSMAAFIQRAIDSGFREICFLDHLTITSAATPMTMAVAEVPLYFQSLQRLKRVYSDRIDVKVGLEIEFHPRYTHLFQQIVDDFAFDAVGSSIHQIDGIDIVSQPVGQGTANPDPATIGHRYLDYLEMMLTHDYFDVICHLDLLKKFGQNRTALIDERLADILRQMDSREVTVEVNTSGYDHPAAEAYPSAQILELLHQAGIGITVGSDAHRPHEIGRHFQQAFAAIQAVGFRQLSVFTGRRRQAVPIPSHWALSR